MNIKLTQEPYIEGYDGAALNLRDRDGREMATCIWDAWFVALAEDEVGETYTVYWAVTNEPDEYDDYDADWDKPYMIVDDCNHNVIDEVALVA